MRKSMKQKVACNCYTQMKIGEVKVADDQDFLNLKHLVEDEPGWTLEFNKENTKVWTKAAPTTNFKMVKVNAAFPNVDPDVLYDVLHDPEYRKVWDTHMIEQHDIGSLNPNNDLGYYAMTCPSPVSKRDFVLQRSWLDTGQEKYIINHSVFHKGFPPRKDFIRAKSYITGFLVRPSKTHGCYLDYVSQSDPCGKLPSVLVNKLTQKVARKLIALFFLCLRRLENMLLDSSWDTVLCVNPTHLLIPSYYFQMVATLHEACQGYPEWKRQHNPHWKPWHNPEQMTKPRVKLEDCKPSPADLQLSEEEIDGGKSSDGRKK
ncbi:START domain-containing protein 10 [Frankliniella fusca]|uniref:START domain-containing protein 10 n=1 Tax=Frankliniella fusca TaxID=407009 RepID=A0AAE1LFE0_9NEOP|nr:START domain-containing protein 10 [Frankliniella fusca]